MLVRSLLRTPTTSLALVILLLLALPISAAELLPIETFFGTEGVRQMELSPDGNKIGLIAPNNGRYSLALLDTTTGKASVVVHLDDEDIRAFFWKGNDRLLYTATIAGHEVPLLESVDLEGKSVKRILEPQVSEDVVSPYSGYLVDYYPSDDEHILIFSYAGDRDPGGIYKVDINTARRRTVRQWDRDTDDGFYSSKDQQRLSTVLEATTVKVVARERNDQPWRTLRKFPITAIEWNLLGLLADDRTAYLVDNTAGKTGALHSLDLDTGKLSAPIFVPEQGEINGVIFSARRQRLIGVLHEDTRQRTHWVDPYWRKIGDVLERNFPDQIVSVVSISDDEKRFLFLVRSDRDPGRYYLGDLRGDALRVQLINAVRPDIKPEQMNPMEPIQFSARDGLTIHGYLTEPGGKAGPETPLLIMPHGGPFGIRDSWSFNPEVQFLANRGYAVLQVNYRGSGGYGDGFERAGYGEWGGKMQDDLTDAVQWAIKQGYANPDRIGIMGASYGGYAALAGVTFTPELYKVGINYVGVSDLQLITHWEKFHSASSRAITAMRIGNNSTQLKARSPVSHVANIRVPTLHAYGRNDPRVAMENWTELEAALKKHGKTYESVVVSNEGHGFEKSENSILFYRQVEAFLKKYLPTGPAASGN